MPFVAGGFVNSLVYLQLTGKLKMETCGRDFFIFWLKAIYKQIIARKVSLIIEAIAVVSIMEWSVKKILYDQ